MSEQRMHFEQANPENSQNSIPDYEQSLSHNEYTSQTDRWRLTIQEEGKALTAKQRSAFAIVSLLLFMFATFFSSAMADNLSSYPAARIILIASLVVVFFIVILFNVLFSFSAYRVALSFRATASKSLHTEGYESPQKQRFILLTTSFIFLLLVLFSTISASLTHDYSQNTIYTYITLGLGSSLYFLAVVIINILFNGKHLDRHKNTKDPH